jgi:L-asparaginase
MYPEELRKYTPTLIITGGYGHTRENFTSSLYDAYEKSLKKVLVATKALLDNRMLAVDAATSAVATLEDDELFNAGRGSVFNRSGYIEMEASICVTSLNSSNDKGRRVVWECGATSLLRHVKNPIKLARAILQDSGTDRLQSNISGEAAEVLAKEWGLGMRDEDYFWTKQRWEEHQSALKCQ